MYLMLMTSVSAHTISDSTPYTFSTVGRTPNSEAKHSLIAYNTLVPMSPYTTPSAVSPRIASRRPVGSVSGGSEDEGTGGDAGGSGVTASAAGGGLAPESPGGTAG